MKNLINNILENVWNLKKIPEDLLYEFSKKTMQIIQKKATDEIPNEFWSFGNYVEMYWRGEKYNHTSDPCLNYQMGQLLTCTNMLNILVEEKEREASLEDYASLLKNRFVIFEGVHKERGITHKDLASLSGISVSALSQFVHRIKAEGFLMCRVMGREKHYYLTEYGEKLYDLMAQSNNKNRMKYAKLRGVINNLNEQIINDSYYKVIMSHNASGITESVYALEQENDAKGIQKLLNISISNRILNSNKEEEIWDAEQNQMLKILSKIS